MYRKIFFIIVLLISSKYIYAGMEEDIMPPPMLDQNSSCNVNKNEKKGTSVNVLVNAMNKAKCAGQKIKKRRQNDSQITKKMNKLVHKKNKKDFLNKLNSKTTKIENNNKKEFNEEGKDIYFYKEKGKRDPFIPLVGNIKTKGKGPSSSANTVMLGSRMVDISLEGILWDEVTASFAIINDEVLAKGDKVQGVKISEIGQNFIEITDNIYRVKVYLKDEMIL